MYNNLKTTSIKKIIPFSEQYIQCGCMLSMVHSDKLKLVYTLSKNLSYKFVDANLQLYTVLHYNL